MSPAEPAQPQPVSLHAALKMAPGRDRLDAQTAHAPRKAFQPHHSQSVPRVKDLEGRALKQLSRGPMGHGDRAVTTLMLRNIPNKYTQTALLKEIDDMGFEGTYDFFYLPMDVHNRSNVGYAFINFELPCDAARFRRAFAGHHFRRFPSKKIGGTCAAHVQGLEDNLKHFENCAVAKEGASTAPSSSRTASTSTSRTPSRTRTRGRSWTRIATRRMWPATIISRRRHSSSSSCLATSRAVARTRGLWPGGACATRRRNSKSPWRRRRARASASTTRTTASEEAGDC